jgi:hypothetical protein
MGRPYIDLRGKLASIGLDQYYEILTSEGFDTWESMLDITEDDLERLHFKLGCRRRLMRTIATYRGYPIATPLPIANTSKNCLIADSQPKNLKTSTYPEQPVKLTYWQSPEISIIAPKLPQENPAVDVRGKY